MTIKTTIRDGIDILFDNSWKFALLFLAISFLALSGCTSAAGRVVDVATVPGSDKRCVLGFCYEREREVDVEALEALTKYMEAKEKADVQSTDPAVQPEQ